MSMDLRRSEHVTCICWSDSHGVPGCRFSRPSVNKPPAFVIAAVHPATVPARLKGPFIAGDRFELRGATVLDMIRLAFSQCLYGDSDDVVGCPSLLDFDRYDVTARSPSFIV